MPYASYTSILFQCLDWTDKVIVLLAQCAPGQNQDLLVFSLWKGGTAVHLLMMTYLELIMVADLDAPNASCSTGSPLSKAEKCAARHLNRGNLLLCLSEL